MATPILDIRMEVASAVGLLRFGEKRLWFAEVNAVNNLAKRAQATVQGGLERHRFIIRKAFVRRQAAVIDGFANVAARRFEARLEVRQPARLLLATFEEGGTRKPFTPGAKHVAVPILGRPARPSLKTGVPPAFTFAGLKLSAYRGGKKLSRRRRGRTVAVGIHGEFGRVHLPEAGSKVLWKGLQRTYLVPKVGVFQRIGTGRVDTRLIWAFRQPFGIDQRLRFRSTVRDVVNLHGAAELQREVDAVFAFRGLQRPA